MAARDNQTRIQMMIGLFVLTGVLILAGLAFLWGSPSGMFAGHYYAKARLAHVGDLAAGAPVRLAGIKKGKVTDIRLEDGGRDVLVTFQVADDLRLPVDSSATVSTSGLVGDSFLELRLGEKPDLVRQAADPGLADVVSGQSPVDLYAAVSEIKTLVGEVDILVRNINAVMGDGAFQSDIRGIAANTKSITDRVNKILGRTGGIIDSLETSAGHFAQALESVKQVAAKTDAAAGDAAGLVKTARLAVDETVGDPKVRQAIQSALVDASAFAKDARGLAGQVGAILKAVAPERVEGLLANAGRALTTFDAKLATLDTDTIKTAVANVGDGAKRVREILAAVDPRDVGDAVKNVNLTLGELAAFLRAILKEPGKALAFNKMVDVYMDALKKEMGRQGVRSPEAIEQMIRRKVDEMLRRPSLAAPGRDGAPRP